MVTRARILLVLLMAISLGSLYTIYRLRLLSLTLRYHAHARVQPPRSSFPLESHAPSSDHAHLPLNVPGPLWQGHASLLLQDHAPKSPAPPPTGRTTDTAASNQNADSKSHDSKAPEDDDDGKSRDLLDQSSSLLKIPSVVQNLSNVLIRNGRSEHHIYSAYYDTRSLMYRPAVVMMGYVNWRSRNTFYCHFTFPGQDKDVCFTVEPLYLDSLY